MKLAEHTINISESIVNALIKIDALPSTLTVFVTDEDQKVVGTITDGDIRRGLINGLTLEAPISKFYHKDFSYVVLGNYDFKALKEFRQKRIKVVPLLDTEGKLIRILDFSISKSFLPIDAVIMAGGKGQRLMPLTKDTPKPLLKVGNKEIISYNIDRLYQFGITTQNITTNYLSDKIASFCSNFNNEINFNIIKEKEYLGTAGALSLIEKFNNETVLLMNSDLLTNIDYEDFYKSFIEKEADMMVASVPYEVNLPYAIFDTNERDVLSFKEKPSYTYYANAGIYLIKKEILALIPKEKFFNATDLMELVKEREKSLQHYPIRGYWLDIGKHEDFERAQKDIAHIDFD